MHVDVIIVKLNNEPHVIVNPFPRLICFGCKNKTIDIPNFAISREYYVKSCELCDYLLQTNHCCYLWQKTHLIHIKVTIM